MHSQITSPTPSLLNRSQVLERLGNKSVSWLYEEMAAGRLPRPIKIGHGFHASVAWVESEISDYIARLIAERRVISTAKPRTRKTKSGNVSRAPEAA